MARKTATTKKPTAASANAKVLDEAAERINDADDRTCLALSMVDDYSTPGVDKMVLVVKASRDVDHPLPGITKSGKYDDFELEIVEEGTKISLIDADATVQGSLDRLLKPRGADTDNPYWQWYGSLGGLKVVAWRHVEGRYPRLRIKKSINPFEGMTPSQKLAKMRGNQQG